MAEDLDIAQALAGVRDANSAFGFIEWFAREWLMPLRDSDGCTAEQVAIVEKRLGLRLPASMVTFYRLLGWRIDLTRNQDTLIFLQSLRVVDGALVYRIEETQACVELGPSGLRAWSWMIRRWCSARATGTASHGARSWARSR